MKSETPGRNEVLRANWERICRDGLNESGREMMSHGFDLIDEEDSKENLMKSFLEEKGKRLV